MVDHAQPVTPTPPAWATSAQGPLNIQAIRTATLHRQPWSHAVITDTFSTGDALAALVDTYPTAGFTRLSQDNPDKRFIIEARNDLRLRDASDPCPWQALLAQLTGPAYRQAMQDMTGLDLGDAVLKIAFYRYGPSCWFGPHRDDEQKLVSHIIYFNAQWPDDAGGNLLINRSADMGDVHSRVRPVAGTSVAVVRSDSSWHSVQPVHPDRDYTRKSVIAHFYKPGSAVDFYDHQPGTHLPAAN